MPHVLTSIDPRGVAHLTLNRPTVHNAFDEQMVGDLIHALDELERDPKVRVLVVNSSGKNFSAGADLNWMRSMADKDLAENFTDARQLATLMHKLDHFSKPSIAQVQGAAFGGALGLVACCDISVATQQASFCLSEVKIGLIPAVISPYVIRAIGEQAARRLFLTAERFFAPLAQQLGLIDHLVADQDQLDSQVAQQVSMLLNNSPAALTAAKSLIKAVSAQPITPAVIDDTAQRIAAIRVSDEGQEGLTAFLEKRQPGWVDTSSQT